MKLTTVQLNGSVEPFSLFYRTKLLGGAVIAIVSIKLSDRWLDKKTFSDNNKAFGVMIFGQS